MRPCSGADDCRQFEHEKVLRRRLTALAAVRTQVAVELLEERVGDSNDPASGQGCSGSMTWCSTSKRRPSARARAMNYGDTADKSAAVRSFTRRWRSSGVNSSTSAAVRTSTASTDASYASSPPQRGNRSDRPSRTRRFRTPRCALSPAPLGHGCGVVRLGRGDSAATGVDNC